MRKLFMFLMVIGILIYAGCENIEITLDGTFTNQTNVIRAVVADVDTMVDIVLLDWKLNEIPQGDSMIIKRGYTRNSLTYLKTVDVAQSGNTTDTLFGLNGTQIYYGLYLCNGTDIEEIYVYETNLLPVVDLVSPTDTVISDTVDITFSPIEDSLRYIVDIYPMDSLAIEMNELPDPIYTDTLTADDLTDGSFNIAFVPDTEDTVSFYNLKIFTMKNLNTSTTFKPFARIKPLK